MGRRKKLVNNTNIPQHRIENIARCILPDILAFYESEEGQKEFALWKAAQEAKKNDNHKKPMEIDRIDKSNPTTAIKKRR